MHIDISYTLHGASHTVSRRELKPDRRRWSFPRSILYMIQNTLVMLVSWLNIMIIIITTINLSDTCNNLIGLQRLDWVPNKIIDYCIDYCITRLVRTKNKI